MPTMTSILAATALVGGGITAFGQFKEGQEAKEAADFNAQIAEQEAGLVRQGAALNLYRQRKQLDIVTGRQVAGFARAGVSVATGTPLDVVADSISNAELEIDIGQFNAEQEARLRESRAKELRRTGRQAARIGTTQAVGTLLTTAVQAGSRISKEKPGKKLIGE